MGAIVGAFNGVDTGRRRESACPDRPLHLSLSLSHGNVRGCDSDPHGYIDPRETKDSSFKQIDDSYYLSILVDMWTIKKMPISFFI